MASARSASAHRLMEKEMASARPCLRCATLILCLLPGAATAQIEASTLPDTPIPPDVAPPAVPTPTDSEGPLAQPGAEGIPDLSGLEGALEGAEEQASGGQRPSAEAMGVARAVSGLVGCMVCTPLGSMGGLLVGMTSYAIWLATQGRSNGFDPAGVGALPYFAFAGSGIGGALAGPLGALAMSAAVDLAQPKLLPVAIAAGVTLVGALAPIGGGIAMYEVGINMRANSDAQKDTAFRLTTLAPVVAAAGILTGALLGLVAYDVSYPLLAE
jgi:hypothetical protein